MYLAIKIRIYFSISYDYCLIREDGNLATYEFIAKLFLVIRFSFTTQGRKRVLSVKKSS